MYSYKELNIFLKKQQQKNNATAQPKHFQW